MNNDPEPNGHGFTDKRKEAIRPEYVLLDGDQTASSGGSNRFEEISNVGRIKVPWAFRIMFALLTLLCGAWFCGSVIGWAFSSVGYMLSFNRAESLDLLVKRFLLGMRRALAFGIGFLASILSPPLGLGFIMLYCLLYEDKEATIARMVRAKYTQYSSR